MIAVTAALPRKAADRPPIVLVHGSTGSAAVWTFWQRELAEAGWASYAVDLRGHGRSDPIDLSDTSMHDYASDVRSLVGQLGRPPVLLGWSMGGLVAMMVAAQDESAACVCLAPSVPARETDASMPVRTGTFGPEEYGITSTDPADQPSMPDLDVEERQIALASVGRESRRARDERKAGIVIEWLPCPLLIVTGTADTEWPRDRYDGLRLGAEHAEVQGASHWGLVLSRRALGTAVPAVLDWLDGLRL